jgi:hypothetical protein
MESDCGSFPSGAASLMAQFNQSLVFRIDMFVLDIHRNAVPKNDHYVFYSLSRRGPQC